MYLYHARVLALEKEFSLARHKLRRLLQRVERSSKPVDKQAVKSQLDLVNALIRLAREETAFFVKLGRDYDYMLFVEEIADILIVRDSDLALEIFAELRERWKKRGKEHLKDVEGLQ